MQRRIVKVERWRAESLLPGTIRAFSQFAAISDFAEGPPSPQVFGSVNGSRILEATIWTKIQELPICDIRRAN
jgi:hypothetical protein